jgi:hypothetical protein
MADLDKPHVEIVHDDDLGTIAQITHPDGTVVTAADLMMSTALWGSASVDVGAGGVLSNFQAPAVRRLPFCCPAVPTEEENP